MSRDKWGGAPQNSNSSHYPRESEPSLNYSPEKRREIKKKNAQKFNSEFANFPNELRENRKDSGKAFHSMGLDGDRSQTRVIKGRRALGLYQYVEIKLNY